MFIERIKIEQFNILTGIDLNFYDEKQKLLILIGKNGSGKTTLLRAIAELFRGIGNEKGLAFNAELWYTIGKHHVKIIRNGNINSYLVDNEPFTSEAFQARAKKLVPEIIISGFSMHGEFKDRPHNYKGFNPIKYFDIAACYGINHFSGRSLSLGLAVLADRLKKDKNNIIHKILGTSGINEIVTHSEASAQTESMPIESFPGPRGVETFELTSERYINDILLSQKKGKPLSLSSMSSGQKMFIYRIASILCARSKSVLLMMEEPELHLDPRWCKHMNSIILKNMRRHNVCALLTTHNHSIAGSVEPEQLLVLDEGKVVEHRNFILGSENEIIDQIYDRNLLLNDTEKKYMKIIQKANQAELEELLNKLALGPMKVFAAIKFERKNVEN
jgi:ABC-type multidrug transport system ATPase subunit